MDKGYISELSRFTLGKIIDFSEFYRKDNVFETNFSDWNVRDVIGHINDWVSFSGKKLKSIKTNQSFEDIGFNDIGVFIKKNYDKNLTVSLDDIVEELKTTFEYYQNILDLYSVDELFGNEFPKVFSFILWEFHLFIHPIMHILYQYMKRKDYNVLLELIEESKKYSNSDVGKYFFKPFFKNTEERENFFKELLENIKNKHNKFVEEIIKANMG